MKRVLYLLIIYFIFITGPATSSSNDRFGKECEKNVHRLRTVKGHPEVTSVIIPTNAIKVLGDNKKYAVDVTDEYVKLIPV